MLREYDCDSRRQSFGHPPKCEEAPPQHRPLRALPSDSARNRTSSSSISARSSSPSLASLRAVTVRSTICRMTPIDWGLSSPVSPFLRLCSYGFSRRYVPFFLVRRSDTVVLGFFLAVRPLTYRPVIADRWDLPPPLRPRPFGILSHLLFLGVMDQFSANSPTQSYNTVILLGCSPHGGASLQTDAFHHPGGP